MAFFARELGVQVDVDDVVCKALADDACSHYQNIHIVVFDALVRGIAVVADAGADARDLIYSDGGADTAAAYQDASIRLVV